MFFVLGAGGHAKVIIDILKKNGEKEILVFDDNNIKKSRKILGSDIVGTIDDAKQYVSKGRFIIGIGNNTVREKITSKVIGKYGVAIHPSAIIGEDVTIGEGTVVMANAVINSGTHVGKHCIINTGATIDHDCFLNDYVHVSPGAHLGGNVRIGRLSWVGLGCSLKNNIFIGEKVTLGVGSVVVNNIVNEGVYYGSPAKESMK